MGTPKDGQMEGTAGERLTELAGRVCYDSLGSGRASGPYIENILSVGHLSIAEHFTVTVRLRGEMSPDLLISLLNRPWTWVNFDDRQTIRITTNIRGVREWDAHSEKCAEESPLYPITTAKTVGLILRDLFHPLAPRIIEKPVHDQVWPMMRALRITESAIAPPEHNSERWVTVYMVGSRGFSHEIVRHGDFTAFSQRCLSGDTVVTFVNKKGHSSTGNAGPVGTRTLKWLYDRWQNPRLRANMKKLNPRVLDEKTGEFTSGEIEDVVCSGKKPCFEVTLDNDKVVACTKDHRIYTDRGWKTLEEIAMPTLSSGGITCWNKDTPFKIATNGVVAVGNGLYRNKEWLTQRYIADGASLHEVAKDCNAKPATVRFWLAKLGVKKREFGDYSGSPVTYEPSDKRRPHSKRKVIIKWAKIKRVRFIGEIDTYDLVLKKNAGNNHGFVGSGVVVHNSTRYCEESESPWVLHPLVQDFLFNGQLAYDSRIDHLIDASRQLYRDLVNELVTFVTPRLKDDPYAKTSARKQARGAARGFLGNALETEIIFSASVSQLLHILRMRAANAADAEIRALTCMLLETLSHSRYASEFKHLTLSEASDGIGQCLQDGGAK
jgi:thymidylate synthase ThyX